MAGDPALQGGPRNPSRDAADLLLTHGYCLAADEHEQRVMKPYPPLGLLYLAAYLRREGFAVDVLDGTFAPRLPLEDVAAHAAPVVGIYTNLTTRGPSLRVIAAAKAGGKVVIMGGPEPANYPEDYLDAGADVVVFGEGEAALAELLPALRSTGPHRLHAVPGVAFRDERGAILRNPARPAMPDLDALPWPAREAIDVSAYLDCWRRHHGAGSISLITARGCPYKCRWCSHAVYGYTHRRRSPGDVADELAHIREAYAPDMVWYADDVFTINYRWLRSYAAELAARGIRVPFETITRADRVTDEVAEHLKAMGCERIWIGSESGSQRVLDAMERGVTVEEVRQAARRLKSSGIAVGMFLMWGYDGETEADVEATVRHVRAVDPDVFFTTVAYPIKGTPYFEAVADRIVPTRSWQAGTDRDVVLAGRHSRRYYDFATRWLRAEVKADRLRGDGLRSLLPAAGAKAAASWARWGMRLTRSEVEA
jgi:radical SAM superfamily enzyme YgiQ (UPF0313 family)